MSFKLKFKKWEIALLEWNLKHLREDSIYAPMTRKWTSTGMGPEVYAENQRIWARKKLVRDRRALQQELAYLKRHYYLERIQEGGRLLDKLTARGEFELLRLQFLLHMRQQREIAWQRKFYMVVFDIPEDKRKFRDFFRNILKGNGFTMLQRSTWISRYNPRPAIDNLLKHLQLTRHFEIMEIDASQFSSRFLGKSQK